MSREAGDAMECPRCFFAKADAVDARRCAVCGRSYRPSVNVYLGLVTLVYIVFVRYVCFILTDNFFRMRGEKPVWDIVRWGRWPVDLQFRPELIPVLGLMLAMLVLVPVVMGILYGKRGGFLLASVALVVGPNWLLGLLLFLGVWIAGGWTLRMTSKAGSAILGCMAVWVAYWMIHPVWPGPTIDVPLATAYYMPALVAVVACVVLALGVGLFLRLVPWNARWVGVGLCVLCVVPIGAYKLWVGEDEIKYAVLSRQVGLESRWFTDAQVANRLMDDVRKQDAEQRAREAREGPPSKLLVPGAPTEEVDEQERLNARVAVRKIAFAAELKAETDQRRQTVFDRCIAFLRRYPSSHHVPDVLFTMIRAIDMEVDTSALREPGTSSLPILYDAGRIKRGESKLLCENTVLAYPECLRAGPDSPPWQRVVRDYAKDRGSRPIYERLLRGYPGSRYAIVAMVRLAADEARYGDVRRAMARYDDVIETYRSEVDAPLRSTSHLSVFANLLDVGDRRREADRARFIDRHFRVAQRERAFLAENSGCPYCHDEVLKAYLQIPLFEVKANKLKKFREMLRTCPKCMLADNVAYELALLESGKVDRMGALEKVAADYRTSDGAALALFALAETERTLEGDLIENRKKAIGHYKDLLRTYPDSYLAPMAEHGIMLIENSL